MASDIIVINKALIRSKAFRSLNGNSIIVLFDFMMKRQIKKVKGRNGRRGEIVTLNNGEITYCYSEALSKEPPISRVKFVKAIDQLIEHGFIDINHQGSGGVKGDKSLYSISDRWEKFGTPDFKQIERNKDTRQGRGFASYWKRGKSLNIGIENDTYMSIENDTPKRQKRGYGVSKTILELIGQSDGKP